MTIKVTFPEHWRVWIEDAAAKAKAKNPTEWLRDLAEFAAKVPHYVPGQSKITEGELHMARMACTGRNKMTLTQLMASTGRRIDPKKMPAIMMKMGWRRNGEKKEWYSWD